MSKCEQEMWVNLSTVSLYQSWTNCLVWTSTNGKPSVVLVTACGLFRTPTAVQTEQWCVFQGSAYGGRFTLSASSCGSIKALAEWICGHLLWTKIQAAELYNVNICNVWLDLTLHAVRVDREHSPGQARAQAELQDLTTYVCCFGKHVFDRLWSFLKTCTFWRYIVLGVGLHRFVSAQTKAGIQMQP